MEKPLIKLPAGRKFPAGELQMSKAVNEVFTTYDRFAIMFVQALKRHLMCDWGDVPSDIANQNDVDVVTGGRLASRYEIPADMGRVPGSALYIVTEADRSETLVLFEHEYKEEFKPVKN